MVPLMLMQFNGKAGWWHPEVRPKKKDTPVWPAVAPSKPLHNSRAAVKWLKEFFNGFVTEPAFLWFFVCVLIFQFSQSLQNPFWFYFLQDSFPDGYV